MVDLKNFKRAFRIWTRRLLYQFIEERPFNCLAGYFLMSMCVERVKYVSFRSSRWDIERRNKNNIFEARECPYCTREQLELMMLEIEPGDELSESIVKARL